MKKITLLLFILSSTIASSQIKTTGVLNLNSNITAKFDLNQATSKVTLTVTSLASSWYGIGFNATATVPGDGMPPLVDAVVLRSATNFSDSRTRSTGSGNPDIDATQNWTVVSNDVSGTIRTIVATRDFNTGDTNDYTFDYNSTSLNLIFASPGSGSFSVQYHGGDTNRGHVVAPLTTLGVEDFSLNATQIYPNPSNGEFLVKAKTTLQKINIYSQTGAFIKSVEVNNETDNPEVNVKGLQTGIYLLELVNETEKSWKKIIVN